MAIFAIPIRRRSTRARGKTGRRIERFPELDGFKYQALSRKEGAGESPNASSSLMVRPPVWRMGSCFMESRGLPH